MSHKMVHLNLKM